MKYYQFHEVDGYTAKVTIEWNPPEGIELLPAREGMAEDIADEMLDFVGPRVRRLCVAMLGRSL